MSTFALEHKEIDDCISDKKTKFSVLNDLIVKNFTRAFDRYLETSEQLEWTIDYLSAEFKQFHSKNIYSMMKLYLEKLSIPPNNVITGYAKTCKDSCYTFTIIVNTQIIANRLF